MANRLPATWSHGVLHVTIPYHGLHSGPGQMTIEVLDPEDEIVGRSERRIEVGDRQVWWQADLKLAKPLALDDLVWHRVRYRFAYSDRKDVALEGAESISQILRAPVVHILGQQSYRPVDKRRYE